MWVDCQFCRGTGRSPNSVVAKEPCEACKGRGKQKIRVYKNTTPFDCAFCHGTGRHPDSVMYKQVCTECKGAGVRAS